MQVVIPTYMCQWIHLPRKLHDRGQLFEMLAAHDGCHWTELKSTLLKNSRDEELKLRCLTITAINPKLNDHSTEHILN